jgi:transposase-like protein
MQETTEQLELVVARCPYCELFTVHEETEKILVGRSSFHCQTCLGVIPDSYLRRLRAPARPASSASSRTLFRSAPPFPSVSAGAFVA